MSDLIRRSDAVSKCIEIINDKFALALEDGFLHLHDAMEIGTEYNDISTIDAVSVEWTPCSERLPKAEDMYQPPEQRYFCQLEAYGERKFCVLSRLKGAVSPFWDWYGVAVRDHEVIAWMPLPEPYEEADRKTEPTISKMEQVKDEPQTERSACDTCQWYNGGIPCGVEPSVCKQEAKDNPTEQEGER